MCWKKKQNKRIKRERRYDGETCRFAISIRREHWGESETPRTRLSFRGSFRAGISSRGFDRAAAAAATPWFTSFSESAVGRAFVFFAHASSRTCCRAHRVSNRRERPFIIIIMIQPHVVVVTTTTTTKKKKKRPVLRPTSPPVYLPLPSRHLSSTSHGTSCRNTLAENQSTV